VEPDAPSTGVAVPDGAQITLGSAEVSDFSVEAAVPSGTEAPMLDQITQPRKEIQDLPPETATATSSAEPGSTESRPPDLKIASIDKGGGD
jgi:hypothetical protein